MKTYKNILLSGLLLFSLSSCSDWFQVEPENEIAKEDLFSSYDGYRTALNGIYRNLSGTSLYGQDLSFGFISLLGQNYEVPSWLALYPEYYFLGNAINYNYEHNNIKSITQAIWEKAYNTIANCNVLIQNTEAHGNDFFYEGENEKNILIGEAKGLRALMHFDILRLFAPAPVTGDDAAYVPYVTVYLTSHPTHLPTSVVLDSIISDLKQAQRLLAYNDTLYNYKMMESASMRFDGNVTGTALGGDFFAYRGTRMNYVAATALLARAYQYKGDRAMAYQYAQEVYRFQSEKGWYRFTPEGNISNTNVQYRRCKLFDDILLAFYNTKIFDVYNDWFQSFYSSYSQFPIKNRTNLFTGDLADFRYRYLLHDTGYSLKWVPITDASALWNVQYQYPLLPVMRMSEIYYIMCEYLAETDLPRAINLLNTLKIARGAAELNTSLTKDEFLDRMYMDATRESIAEGQTFYLYKRLNRDMYNGEYPIDMSGGKYVIPLPDSETIIQ